MKNMHPYQQFVASYARLYSGGKGLPLGGFASRALGEVPADAPRVLIFSPHPDDECIIGALPLRLLRQSGMRIINVAVTQGSKKERQAERYEELKKACAFLGFDLVQTAPNGLEKVNAKTRKSDSAFWKESVQAIAATLKENSPTAIFFPHDADWNSSHIGTHWLVVDALSSLGEDFSCFTVETEYWGQNHQPNVMVESTSDEVADLVAGTSFHVGEVTRNPFHLFLPAWMQDNVRRGSELVGGQGEAAPSWNFATLYRLRRWAKGGFQEVLDKGRVLPSAENPKDLFQPA